MEFPVCFYRVWAASHDHCQCLKTYLRFLYLHVNIQKQERSEGCGHKHTSTIEGAFHEDDVTWCLFSSLSQTHLRKVVPNGTSQLKDSRKDLLHTLTTSRLSKTFAVGLSVHKGTNTLVHSNAIAMTCEKALWCLGMFVLTTVTSNVQKQFPAKLWHRRQTSSLRLLNIYLIQSRFARTECTFSPPPAPWHLRPHVELRQAGIEKVGCAVSISLSFFFKRYEAALPFPL